MQFGLDGFARPQKNARLGSVLLLAENISTIFAFDKQMISLW